jgi:hypothetical protein
MRFLLENRFDSGLGPHDRDAPGKTFVTAALKKAFPFEEVSSFDRHAGVETGRAYRKK